MDREQSEHLLVKSLVIPVSDETSHENGVEMTKEGQDVSAAEVVSELKKQVQLAGPLIVVSVLQYSLQTISVMFVGHLGELALSSASMATSFAGVTGFSLMLGMGGALETFCGQAYGAKQYHMLGVHTQRAMLVFVLLGVPISLLWWCTGYIFTIFRQDPEMSKQAGMYIRWLIPSIFPFGLLQCILRFLQTQNNISPVMISTGISSLVHVLLCWCFIFVFGLGNKGAALSLAISYWMNVLILAFYIKLSPACEKTWQGFCKEGMRNLGSFFSLAVPSALMLCLEFWAYEFLVLMSGLLPNPKLETSMMSVSLNATSVVYRIPYGLGSAVRTRVSNELGAGKPKAAKLAVQVVIFLAVAEGLMVGSVSIAVRDLWGYLYTNEEEVVKYFASLMTVLAISSFMDGIQGVVSGVARGCGWQKLGVYVNLGAYYTVGLPCAIALAFLLHFGGKGLWMGIIGGSGVQAILLLAITIRIDWEQEGWKAQKRVNASIASEYTYVE